MSLKKFVKIKAIVVMSKGDSVMAAIDRMIEAGSGAVMVADPASRLIGLVTERDIVTRVTAKHLDPDATALGDIMTTKVITVTEDAPISEAIQTMVDHRIRHLPVVDPDNRIIGIISLRYLLHDRINELVSEIRALESYFNDAPGG